MDNKIRLGISSCLLGNRVRYNGGHQLDHYLVSTLGKFVDFVPVCPEVECGLGTPRETLRLVETQAGCRLKTTKTDIDHTDRMLVWAEERLQQLAGEELHGFVFKSRSPSSGMERVKVYNAKGGLIGQKGVGLFAGEFMKRFPLLPVEEDGRLHDLNLRENFIERIFTYKRWRDMLAQKRSQAGLVAFHGSHKLLIMAHSEQKMRQMGKIVAHPEKQDFEQMLAVYENLLMEALKLKATVKKNINVLQHIMGYFKQVISGDEKRELLEVIDLYRLEQLPLIVPVTLLNHYVRKYDQPYLKDQYYLHPHPLELQLRNHV